MKPRQSPRDLAISAARNTTWTSETFIRNHPDCDPAQVKRIFDIERRAK